MVDHVELLAWERRKRDERQEADSTNLGSSRTIASPGALPAANLAGFVPGV